MSQSQQSFASNTHLALEESLILLQQKSLIVEKYVEKVSVLENKIEQLVLQIQRLNWENRQKQYHDQYIRRVNVLQLVKDGFGQEIFFSETQQLCSNSSNGGQIDTKMADWSKQQYQGQRIEVRKKILIKIIVDLQAEQILLTDNMQLVKDNQAQIAYQSQSNILNSSQPINSLKSSQININSLKSSQIHINSLKSQQRHIQYCQSVLKQVQQMRQRIQKEDQTNKQKLIKLQRENKELLMGNNRLQQLLQQEKKIYQTQKLFKEKELEDIKGQKQLKERDYNLLVKEFQQLNKKQKNQLTIKDQFIAELKKTMVQNQQNFQKTILLEKQSNQKQKTVIQQLQNQISHKQNQISLKETQITQFKIHTHKFQSQVSQLQNQIKQINQKNYKDQLQSVQTKTKKQLQIQQLIQHHLKETSQTRYQIKSLEDQLNQLNQTIFELKRQLQDQKKLKNQLQDQVHKIKVPIIPEISNKNEIQEQINQIKTLESNIKELSTKLQNQSGNYEIKIKQLNQQNYSIKQQRDSLKEQNNSLNHKISELNQINNSLNQQKNSINQKINLVNQKNQQLNCQIDLIKIQVNSLNQQNSSLNQQIKQIKSTYTQSAKQLTSKTFLVLNLQQKVSQLSQQLFTQQQQAASLRNMFSTNDPIINVKHNSEQTFSQTDPQLILDIQFLRQTKQKVTPESIQKHRICLPPSLEMLSFDFDHSMSSSHQNMSNLSINYGNKQIYSNLSSSSFSKNDKIMDEMHTTNIVRVHQQKKSSSQQKIQLPQLSDHQQKSHSNQNIKTDYQNTINEDNIMTQLKQIKPRIKVASYSQKNIIIQEPNQDQEINEFKKNTKKNIMLHLNPLPTKASKSRDSQGLIQSRSVMTSSDSEADHRDANEDFNDSINDLEFELADSDHPSQTYKNSLFSPNKKSTSHNFQHVHESNYDLYDLSKSVPLIQQGAVSPIMRQQAIKASELLEFKSPQKIMKSLIQKSFPIEKNPFKLSNAYINVGQILKQQNKHAQQISFLQKNQSLDSGSGSLVNIIIESQQGYEIHKPDEVKLNSSYDKTIQKLSGTPQSSQLKDQSKQKNNGKYSNEKLQVSYVTPQKNEPIQVAESLDFASLKLIQKKKNQNTQSKKKPKVIYLRR